MKVNEGEEIPGLEELNWTSSDVEKQDVSVSELCERRFEDAYKDSWLSDILHVVDATDVKSNYYDGGDFTAAFDKYARANLLNDGWSHGWIIKIVESMENEVVERVREDCEVTVLDNYRDIIPHFNNEHGFDGYERIKVDDNLYLVANPDLFGKDIVRVEFTVDHHASQKVQFDNSPNYVIGWTRRAFVIDGPAFLYEIKDEG